MQLNLFKVETLLNNAFNNLWKFVYIISVQYKQTNVQQLMFYPWFGEWEREKKNFQNLPNQDHFLLSVYALFNGIVCKISLSTVGEM